MSRTDTIDLLERLSAELLELRRQYAMVQQDIYHLKIDLQDCKERYDKRLRELVELEAKMKALHDSRQR